MKEKILLNNRYREVNYLQLVNEEEKKYQMVFTNPAECGYTRVGLKENTEWEDKDYFFIDPSGGPFLTIGSEIDGYEIVKITSEFIDGKESYIIYFK